jgi:hypothetical protein
MVGRVGGFCFVLAKGVRVEMEAKLYVENLSYETTDQSLCELFMQAGSVASVNERRLNVNINPGEARGDFRPQHEGNNSKRRRY